MAGWSALPRLRGLSRPVLLLCGGEHDTVPHHEYEALARDNDLAWDKHGVKRLHVRVLEGAGHAAFYEPEWRDGFFADVEAFVNSLGSSSK